MGRHIKVSFLISFKNVNGCCHWDGYTGEIFRSRNTIRATNRDTKQPPKVPMGDYILEKIPRTGWSTEMCSIGFNALPEFMFETGDTTHERFPHHVSPITYCGIIRDCNKPRLMITFTPLCAFHRHYSHYHPPLRTNAHRIQQIRSVSLQWMALKRVSFYSEMYWRLGWSVF